MYEAKFDESRRNLVLAALENLLEAEASAARQEKEKEREAACGGRLASCRCVKLSLIIFQFQICQEEALK